MWEGGTAKGKILTPDLASLGPNKELKDDTRQLTLWIFPVYSFDKFCDIYYITAYISKRDVVSFFCFWMRNFFYISLRTRHSYYPLSLTEYAKNNVDQ